MKLKKCQLKTRANGIRSDKNVGEAFPFGEAVLEE
jgi:hypothetical protein